MPFVRFWVSVVCAALMFLVPSARAQGWQSQPFDLPGPVSEVRQIGSVVYVRADDWYRLSACDGGICSAPGSPPPREVRPDGIPGGYVATAPSGDVTQAWYANPTNRYPHAVLGDGIEGGSLEAIVDGKPQKLSLDVAYVFEDIAPRIVDLDGNGRNEVIAIRSGFDRGGGLVVYGVRDGELTEVASALPLNRPFRWLNVAGIDDFDGDGRDEIAIVVTPHLKGTLQVWAYQGGALTLVAEADGYSNHAIGMSELDMSAVAVLNGGAVDLAIPSLDRRSLRFAALDEGRLIDLGQVALGGEASTAIGYLQAGEASVFIVGLADGRAVAVLSDQ